MQELKQQVEAVLFAVGKNMHIEDISKICKIKDQQTVVNVLNELQNDYEERNGPVKVLNDGENWKLSVAEKFIPVIQNLGVETELSKSVMETLAVIAWKYPILQNEVIHIRTNKAYDHMMDLEERGFITRQKHGRTKTIRLTEKFFQYFDLPNKEEAKNAFKDIIPQEIQDKVNNLQEAIILGEKQAIDIKEKKKVFEDNIKKERAEQAKLEAGLDLEDDSGKTHHLKEYESEESKDIALEDDKTGEPIELEPYGEKRTEVEVEKEVALGELKTYEETPEEQKKNEETEEEKKDDDIPEGEGVKADEKKVDEAVEKLIHPEQEEENKQPLDKENNEETNKEQKDATP